MTTSPITQYNMTVHLHFYSATLAAMSRRLATYKVHTVIDWSAMKRSVFVLCICRMFVIPEQTKICIADAKGILQFYDDSLCLSNTSINFAVNKYPNKKLATYGTGGRLLITANFKVT